MIGFLITCLVTRFLRYKDVSTERYSGKMCNSAATVQCCKNVQDLVTFDNFF